MLGFLFVFLFLIVFVSIHLGHRIYFGKVIFQAPLDGYLLDIRSKWPTSRKREVTEALKRLDHLLDRAGLSSTKVTDSLEIVLGNKNKAICIFDLRFMCKTHIIYLNVNSENMVEDLFESYKKFLS